MRSGFIFEVLRLSYMTTYSLDTSGVQADIGLSMGIQGTEVAKESSDIIILDDNFASVVKVLVVNLDSKVKSREVVCWGRSVYANIQKFIQFQLTVNVAALITNVIAAVSSGNVPLNAVQVGYFSGTSYYKCHVEKSHSSVYMYPDKCLWKTCCLMISGLIFSVGLWHSSESFFLYPRHLLRGSMLADAFGSEGEKVNIHFVFDRTIRWLTCDRCFGLADDSGSGARPPVNGSSV
ncbi:hypothetical protein BHM03_00058131 [Ensete ventricosum]|nr:hypothetical protein BHM03_00058131 [Ensete ventricosum]